VPALKTGASPRTASGGAVCRRGHWRGRQTERGFLLDVRLIALACRASPATPRTHAQGPALPQMRSANLRRAAPLRMSAAEPIAAGAKVTFTQEMRNKAMSLHTFSQVSTRRGLLLRPMPRVVTSFQDSTARVTRIGCARAHVAGA